MSADAEGQGKSGAQGTARPTAQVKEFKRLLKERGMSLQELARVAMVGRCHLSGVIHGKRSSGSFSRPRVAAHLTAAELEALNWENFTGANRGNGERNFPEGAARGVPLAAAAPSTGAATQELDAGMATVPAEQSRTRQSAGKRGEILKGSQFAGKTILDLERGTAR